MKNVQVIDRANNAAYDIYACTDDEFTAIFPDEGQNIEFIEELVLRIGDEEAGVLLAPLWARPVRKPDAQGIHGTLFYEFYEIKRKFYPRKRESDLDDNHSRGWKHG